MVPTTLNKTVYYTSELSPEIMELRASLNSMKGLTVDNFADALQQIDKLSVENLCLLYASDTSVGKRANVENEIFRGVICELLREAEIEVDSLPRVNIVDAEVFLELPAEQPITAESCQTKWRAFVVCPDKTIRAREVFDINFPVPGKYKRNLKKHASSLDCVIKQVYFTDRVGMPLFLSSLSAHFDTDDYEAYGIRDKDLTISERSFQTTALGWNIIFNELRRLAIKLYSADAICLRKHFAESFKTTNLIDSPEIDTLIHEAAKKTRYRIASEVVVTG